MCMNGKSVSKREIQAKIPLNIKSEKPTGRKNYDCIRYIIKEDNTTITTEN